MNRATLSFVQPLFQHRAVCVVGADAAFFREHGARSVAEASALAGVAAESIEFLFCQLAELNDEVVTGLARVRAAGGVVVLQTTADPMRAAQTLAMRFASVERADVVRGDALWVGPPGAVTATVSADDTAAVGAVFVCGDRPQRLALGSVHLGAARVSLAVERSLSGELAESLDEDRLREVESRLSQTMEDLQQAQLIAAQALAERDTLRRKLESEKGSGTISQQQPATHAEKSDTVDTATLIALRDELDAIEALVRRRS